MNPKVSIILPVYNVEKYIDKCVGSLLNQSFDDFEVLIINDGSTDSSAEACNRWAERDSKVKVFHQQNAGVAAARNQGLANARGEFVFFADPDDWIESNLLEDCYSLATKYKTDIVLFGFFKEQLRNGNEITTKIQPPELYMLSKTQIRQDLVQYLTVANGFSVWTKFIKKSLITEHNLSFPAMRRGQDMAFSLELYANAHSIVATPNCYYHYNAFSETNKYDPDIISNHIYLYDKMYRMFDNWLEEKKNSAYAVRLFILWFCYVIPANIVANKKSTKTEKLRELRTLMSQPSIRLYLNKFNKLPHLPFISRTYLNLLRFNNAVLLLYITKLARFINSRSSLNLKKAIRSQK